MAPPALVLMLGAPPPKPLDVPAPPDVPNSPPPPPLLMPALVGAMDEDVAGYAEMMVGVASLAGVKTGALVAVLGSRMLRDGVDAATGAGAGDGGACGNGASALADSSPPSPSGNTRGGASGGTMESATAGELLST